MLMRVPYLFIVLLLLFCGCNTRTPEKDAAESDNMDWQDQLDAKLPAMGHRNWILVVDKAYPAQSATGVEVINTAAELPDVLQYALGQIREAKHVAPVIYQDSELRYLNDSMVGGVTAFKKQLDDRLSGLTRQSLPHDSLLAQTSADASKYQILVMKTESLIPYSSVFIQLDCGYWNGEQEGLLRQSMGSNKDTLPAIR